MSRAKLFGMAVLWLFTTQAICLVTISLHDQWVEAHKPNPCDSPDVLCVTPLSDGAGSIALTGGTNTGTLTAHEPVWPTKMEHTFHVDSVSTTQTITLPDWSDLKPGTCWAVSSGRYLSEIGCPKTLTTPSGAPVK
jgi:hypothetical protein